MGPKIGEQIKCFIRLVLQAVSVCFFAIIFVQVPAIVIQPEIYTVHSVVSISSIIAWPLGIVFSISYHKVWWRAENKRRKKFIDSNKDVPIVDPNQYYPTLYGFSSFQYSYSDFSARKDLTKYDI